MFLWLWPNRRLENKLLKHTFHIFTSLYCLFCISIHHKRISVIFLFCIFYSPHHTVQTSTELSYTQVLHYYLDSLQLEPHRNIAYWKSITQAQHCFIKLSTTYNMIGIMVLFMASLGVESSLKCLRVGWSEPAWSSRISHWFRVGDSMCQPVWTTLPLSN